MKARAAASQTRKKLAGTHSRKAAVRRLADGGTSSRNVRKQVEHDTRPAVVGKVMSKKRARRVHKPLRGTQSQTHRAAR